MFLEPKIKSRQYLNSKYYGKTKFINYKKQKNIAFKKTSKESSLNISFLVILVDNTNITFEDKLECLKVTYAKQKHKDVEAIVDRLELIFQKKNRYIKFGLVVFGFTLYHSQINIIWTLYYKCRDLLLLAKTGFKKSLIFYLFFFSSYYQSYTSAYAIKIMTNRAK